MKVSSTRSECGPNCARKLFAVYSARNGHETKTHKVRRPLKNLSLDVPQTGYHMEAWR
jgi:hypothetical protein